MSWAALLLGPVAVGLLFAGWLLVQALWRRAFELPDQTDVLAGRSSCAGCARSGTSAAGRQTDQRASGHQEDRHDR